MVETVYDLCQSSMFTTTFTAKPGLSFFFPLGNLSLDPGGKKTRIVSVLLRRTQSSCRYQCFARGAGRTTG